MDKKKLIDNLLIEGYQKGLFNGVWLYAENEEIITKGAVGFLDQENKLPVQENSVFEMASVTKQFTATAIMLLLRDNKLQLDDSIVKYLPSFIHHGVTIRHLLNHTSGLPHYDVEEIVTKIKNMDNKIPSNKRFVNYICELKDPLIHKPGEVFCYTDVGYTMLAEIVEVISKEKFEKFLQERIFKKALMKDSLICHTRINGYPSDRFARNMVLENGVYILSYKANSTANYVINSDGLNGCDYLYTTIFDMLAWDKALREGTILSLEEQELMFTPGLLNDGNYAGSNGYDIGYGFGFGIRKDEKNGLIVHHGGCMPGVLTSFLHFVDKNKTFMFFNSREPKNRDDFNILAYKLEEIISE